MKLIRFEDMTNGVSLDFSDGVNLLFGPSSERYLSMLHALLERKVPPDCARLSLYGEVALDDGKRYLITALMDGERSDCLVFEKGSPEKPLSPTVFDQRVKRGGNQAAILFDNRKRTRMDCCLGESALSLVNFREFLSLAERDTENGDTRPILVWNFFERLDESEDVAPYLNALEGLKRQVLIAYSPKAGREKLTRGKAFVLD